MGIHHVLDGGEQSQTREDLVVIPQHQISTSSVDQDLDEDFEDFRPLVIDTQRKSSTSELPLVLPSGSESLHNSQRHLVPERLSRQSSVSSDTASRPRSLSLDRLESKTFLSSNEFALTSEFSTSQPSIMGTPTSGEASSASTPSSSSSQKSTPTSGPGSAPYKARRKNDKILPVSVEHGEKFICPICKEEMFDQPELTKHIRSHNASAPISANTCTICGKVLSSQSSLDRHMLVHSGERPFKCRICKMAFTTNGNMHRHMRIHEKELENGTSTTPRDIASKSRRRHHADDMSFLLTPGSSVSSRTSSVSTGAKAVSSIDVDILAAASASKRKLSFGEHSDELSAFMPVKRRVTLSEGDHQDLATRETIVPKFRIMEHKPNMMSYTFPSSGSHTFSMLPRKTSSVENKTNSADPLQCPVCSRTFLCKYGLDTHLDTHQNENVTCKLCFMTLGSAKHLSKHMSKIHCSQENPHDEENLSEYRMASISRSMVPVGFHELGFMDFSTEKFPLVARAWCEGNPRRASSSYHNFVCPDCDKSFPCQSALMMHCSSHTQDNTTVCDTCDSAFPSPNAQKIHALQHIGTNIVNNFTKTIEKDPENELHEKVSKEEFLAVLDLKTSGSKLKKECEREKRSRRHKEDMKMNQDYFIKLGQASYAKNASAWLKHAAAREYLDHNSTNDFADIQQIIKVAGLPKVMTSQLPSQSQSGQSMAISDMPKLQRMPPPLMPRPHQTLLPQPPPLKMMSTEPTKIKVEVPDEDGGVPINSQYNVIHIAPKDQDDRDMQKNSDIFVCGYCNETFSNARAFKSHERAHLGLAPYKCHQCSYSSADKSTLIRHLRTHNGERPFQCKVCDFAFTTKANCERHVRKKHAKENKQEIEEAIGYNEFMQEGAVEIDAFASPDTICKYCGEDFKFFRALKHHLRSHSSCKNKPFLCKLCKNGFSTKANCVRHVQKQHLEIEQSHLEENIYVNEALAEKMAAEMSGSESYPNSRASSPGFSGTPQMSPRPMLTPPSSLSPHPSMRLPLMAPPRPSAASSPASSVASFTLKQEPMDTEHEQPIDFSMKASPLPRSVPEAHKNAQSLPFGTYSGPNQTNKVADEQPMDLTVHKRTPEKIESPVPNVIKSSSGPSCNTLHKVSSLASHNSGGGSMLVEGSGSPYSLGGTTGIFQYGGAVNLSPDGAGLDLVSASLGGSSHHPMMPPEMMDLSASYPAMYPSAASFLSGQFTTPDYGMLRYKKEYQKFYNPVVGRLQCPYCKMLFKHGLKLQVHIRSHTNERPFKCPHCDASFTIKTNLERHLKTRHLQRSSDDICDDLMDETLDTKTTENNNNLLTMDNNNNKNVMTMRYIIPPRSPANGYGSTNSDSSNDLASITKMLDATNPTNFRAFFSVTDDSNRNNAENHMLHKIPEPASLSKIPEPVLQKVSEPLHPRAQTPPVMKSREKVTVFKSEKRDEKLFEKIAIVKKMQERCITPDQSTQDSEVMRRTVSPTPTKAHVTPTNSPSKVNASSAADGEPPKKKRNSYADSPHKLTCPYCPRAFPWISSLNRHILTHTGQKPFKCPKCPVMFSTKSNRERHLVRKHGLNVLDPATRQMMDRPFKCHLCVFSSFSTGGNLLRHYREKHPDADLPEHLQSMVASGGDMGNYPENMDGNSCMSDGTSDKKTMNLEDDGDYEDEEKLNMEHREAGFGKLDAGVNSKKLLDHPPIVVRASTPAPRTIANSTPQTTPPDTPERHINPERDNYNVDKITCCWKCGEEFSSRKVLLKHLKEHNIDLPFKCYLCDASYDARIQCLEHMVNKHSTDWTMLRDKNQVTDVQEFAECMNRIVEQNFLNQDTAGDKSKINESDLAKVKVTLGDDLRPESDYLQRKVYCSLCPKRFWSLQDLRRHMRSHTGERPFECDICQKRFTLKHSMMRHRRKHTEAEYSAALSASDDEVHPQEGSSADDRFGYDRLLPLYLQNDIEKSVGQSSSTIWRQKLEDSRPVAMVTGGNNSSVGFGSLASDLLGNLLGVQGSDIDNMLESADDAAKMLGVK